MKYVIFLLVLFVSTACGSMPPAPPDLKNRSLRISPAIPGFEYQYEICVKKGLFGNCRETKWVKDTYDLSDPEVRQRLIDMGFVLRVREKVTP